MKKNLIDYELLWEKITDYVKATSRTVSYTHLFARVRFAISVQLNPVKVQKMNKSRISS